MIRRAALVLALLCSGPTHAQDVANGRYLAQLAACQSCHTAKEGAPFAGGYAIKTKFGTFYGTNITPDPETGIGDWTERDFFRALKHGKNPRSKPYYPSFPYTSFTGMKDSDIRDIFAYLATVEPVFQPNSAHELRPFYRNRGLLRPWRLFNFKRNPHPKPEEKAELERGRYLTNVVGHCGECHTPRSGMGGLKRRRWLAGQVDDDTRIPNITPYALGDWSLEDMEAFLEMGMTPDGDFTGGDMSRVIEDCTGPLNDADRRAMALYLQSLKAMRR